MRFGKFLAGFLMLMAFAGADPLVVYDDALQNGFQDWSWATHDLASTGEVAGGTYSISMEPDNWEALYFHTTSAIDISVYHELSFWIFGSGGGGQVLSLSVQLTGSSLLSIDLAPAASGIWEERMIDFADHGLISGFFDELIFQDRSGGDQLTIYVDGIELAEDTSPPVSTPIEVVISPDLDRRVINPMIYGVNFGDASQLANLRFPVRRWGGNSTTRYNYAADVSNRALDWFYFNIPNAVDDPGALPDGSSADVFIDEALAAGSEPLLTAPAIGWVPLDERIKMWSFSVDKYGPQLLTECTYFDPPPAWCEPDAGDGTCDPVINMTGYCSSDGLIVGNDPLDTSQPAGSSWTSLWMSHIASRVGSATQGGPQLWAIDNEPMLWNSTHRDVHPDPATYDELWSRTVDLASTIKAVDPAAEVLGPAVWGWCAYFSSAADAAANNGSCVDGPDRQAHGGLPLIEWYLDQICSYEAIHGVRLVDYLDVHFYPQGTVSGLGGASSSEDPVTAARRLRSLKELYDPTYISESWIADNINLIPRLRAWIDGSCPGIKLAITEYKWGPDDGLSGALAQAEVLAIFGREGVDLATRWVAPNSGTLAEDAFRLYLDYDSTGSRIEGDSVRAESEDVDAVGAYAIRALDDTLYVLLFNKDLGVRECHVAAPLSEIAQADVYRFDGSSGLAWVEAVSSNPLGFSVELPPRSATLVVTQLGGQIFRDGFESGDMSLWSSAVQ